MIDLHPRCLLMYIKNITIYSPSLQQYVTNIDAFFQLEGGQTQIESL